MRKQKGLVVCLCILLFAVGLIRNQQVWEVSTGVVKNEKIVALTFDDGPHRIYTERLLDGLKERNVVATFFLVGENIRYNEELVERMAEEGHLIGNHTYSHVQLTKIPVCDAEKEINLTNDVIRKITGKAVEYIRPPYGSWNKELSDAVSMNVALWNVDPEDWKNWDSDKVVEEVKEHVRDGSVILMHDIFKTSVEAALEIIDYLQEEGYEFVTVEELLIN